MKLLISGTTGFIGKHLVRRLTEERHGVHAIVRPSSNTDFLMHEKIPTFAFDDDINGLIEYMRQERFDGVMHLASLFLAQHKPDDIPGLVESNILFSTCVLEAAVQSGIPWFLNTGTNWQHFQNETYSPVNLYSATKQAFEDIARYYLETSTINFSTIKLFDTFGPDDTRPKLFILWNKISKSGETLDMSPGEQIMDISYIDNVIDGFMKMAKLLAHDTKRSMAGKSFALRSNERMTLKELSRVFEEVTGTKLNIRWGERPYRTREVMVPWETGEMIPGWKPNISLRDGIRKTFNAQ